MSAWDNYITLSADTPSRSGLYANRLPGVSIAMLDDLTKEDQDDFDQCFSELYETSKINFTSDIQGLLGNKFHYDQKLVTRETSKFLADLVTGSERAGIKLGFTMPKYARMHVISVEVWADEAYQSPELTINFNETDENGELLHSVSEAVTAGRNVINVDEDFEVDDLFISIDPASFSVKQTENKYYRTDGVSGDKLSCTFPCGFGGYGYAVSVDQINGGGINVKFVVTCSVDKFICENINLFKTALWYRIGLDLMRERIVSDRFNIFTTLTQERAEQLMAIYQGEYDKHLKNSVESMNITEDPICFDCKNVIESGNLIP